MLACAARSFLIAADVMKSMHQRYGSKLRDRVMCLALDTFLTCLHVHYTTAEELKEKSGKSNCCESVEKTLDGVQSDVRMWLKTKMVHCRSDDLLACLKAWNKVLQLDAVPQGYVRDQFIGFISESLHEELQYRTKFEEELVKIYCQNQNTFCSVMLDVLSKYVFEWGWLPGCSLFCTVVPDIFSYILTTRGFHPRSFITEVTLLAHL
ncbi:unnamed protein product [Mytilus edulis]|uniref:Uncharacterized protein n=1 Tax=Mytilus edulis TaxID=6550 RepID=A0A8S3U265_MYTED|nr:unnamed protein product [Mytilus edulis]